jgi:cation transport protein ChaC
VVPAHKGATVQYLYQREMVTRVYVPVLAPVRLDNGRQVKALTFIVDRTHAQYAGKLGAEQAAVTIRRARGKGGANTDYIANTVAHLDELGIADSLLHEIHALLNAAQ